MSTLLHDNKEVLWLIAALSGLMFVASLVFVPWLVVRIPHDYFLTPRRPRSPIADHHPVLRWVGLIAKNVTGCILLLAGIAMLLFPGQGMLTIAVGILLVDFPGKHRLERRIIRTRPVLRSVNWLRRKAHAQELVLEPNTADPAEIDGANRG